MQFIETMNQAILSVAALLAITASHAAVTFDGSSKEAIFVTPESSTGLNGVIVLYDFNSAKMQYTAASAATVTWYRFSNLGGGYAEAVTGVEFDGKTSSLDLTGTSDMGYIIEEGTTRYYYWVVDYSGHRLELNSLSLAPDQECGTVSLNVSGRGEAITYYTINGQARELDRELALTYRTLSYNAEQETYDQVETTLQMSSLGSTIQTTAPLCDTEFELSGDRFLTQWGEGASITSESYTTKAVEAQTSATQSLRENDNEKDASVASLGGSAPVEIEFKAVCSDAAIYKEWQMSTDSEFENVTLRFNEDVTTYTFREYGTFYMRFVTSDASGECSHYGEVYDITIGESKLECPNAFSPGNADGVNDEWKVSYESIVSFECHIFNRWGVKMAELTDPSQGWDGKYKGKLVPSGVYFYVIKAEGADGQKYDLSGDINIINFKSPSQSASSTGTE